MKPVQVSEHIWWVGALDPQIRVFDVVMPTGEGTTYNAYLVKGEAQTALVDCVKPKFTRELVANVSSLVDPASLDYIVVNHTEPDHGGALASILEIAPQAKVVISKTATGFLKGLLGRDIDPILAADGDEIDLGGVTLRFLWAPFLHWPDTMLTYAVEDKVLMPCDYLGCHYCDDRLFDDSVDDFEDAFHYYFDVIMRPFKEFSLKALDKIEQLPIDIIAPSHGPILRTDPAAYLARYREWSSAPGPKKLGDPLSVLVFYASAYGNTERMAKEIAAGIESAGAHVALLDATNIESGSVLPMIEAADALVVGSPTIQADAVEPIWRVLSHLITIKVKGKYGAAFGSYAWSGEAPQMITGRLRDLKLRTPLEPLRAKFVVTDDDLAAARAFGGDFVEAVRAGTTAKTSPRT